MASSASELGDGADSAAPFTSDSITPTNGNLCLVGVFGWANGGTAPGSTSVTLSGCGQTWNQEFNLPGITDGSTGTARLAVFSAHVSSASTGQLTATYTGTAPAEVIFKIQEISEVPASGAVIQANGTAGSSTSPATTLSAFADATNNVCAAFCAYYIDGTRPTISFGSLTELGTDQQDPFNAGIAHAWGIGQDTTPDATLSGSAPWGIIALEIDNDGGGDVTAPTLSSATDSATGGTTGSGSVSTDEGNGTLYWVVTTSATSPSAAQVKAGNDHTGSAAADAGSQAVSGTGVQNVSGGFTGLSSETAYFAHYMHEDAAANQSTVASADGFTTNDVTAPTLSSPTDTAASSTSGAGSVSTNEGNGTLYWVVTTSGTSPSAAQVKAGNDHTGSAAADSGSQAVSGTGVQNVSGGFTGLTPSTAYFAHYMHEDSSTNQSTVSSADGFTTNAASSALPIILQLIMGG